MSAESAESPTSPSSRSRRRRRRPRTDGKGSDRDQRDRPASSFVLYVEGPRDRDLLKIWARRVSHGLARSLESCVVIMGGRQPARAAEHFTRVHGEGGGVTGLVVLDRDHHDPAHDWAPLSALELFTWPRRHIESYVLVPDAIRRAAGVSPDDGRIDRVLQEHLPPPSDPAALQAFDAKRLLDRRGPLARELGRPVATAEIARCMRLDEVHADVLGVLDRVGRSLGVGGPGPEIVVRGRSAR